MLFIYLECRKEVSSIQPYEELTAEVLVMGTILFCCVLYLCLLSCLLWFSDFLGSNSVPGTFNFSIAFGGV